MIDEMKKRAYLDRLGIEGIPDTSLESLDELVYAHHTHIPFETIAIHRSGETPDLSIDTLYSKIITEGKGGYCFELNKLFQALLDSLGFETRPVLCRAICGREARMPINHRGMLVTISGEDHFVDVGFGGPMPAGPMSIEHGDPQDIHGDIFMACDGDNGWINIDRYTKAKADPFDDDIPVVRQTELALCTADVEDLDFEVLNIYCSQPGTLFRDHDVVNLRTDDGHIAYQDGVLTIRENGNKTIKEMQSAEEERETLLKYFGLDYR